MTQLDPTAPAPAAPAPTPITTSPAQVGSTASQVRADLVKALDDQLDNALAFLNKGLDILSGDAEPVISDAEASAATLALAHIPDVMGLREEAQLVVGPLIAKKAGQLVINASEQAKLALAIGIKNLEATLH